MLLVGGMLLTGRLGVPRRVWDVTYAQATVPVGGFAEAPVQLGLAMLGVGAVVSVVGGAMFVAVTVGTLLLGRRSANPVQGLRLALGAHPGPEGKSPERGARGRFLAPGTLALCFVFLTLTIAPHREKVVATSGSGGLQGDFVTQLLDAPHGPAHQGLPVPLRQVVGPQIRVRPCLGAVWGG